MTRLTLFTAILVQDTAISVSGLDRGSSSDRPFTVADGVPTISGRGLKGAAVAMARRFFDPIPRSVSEDAGRNAGFRRSAWEFLNTRPEDGGILPPVLRAGVGICQKTSARAHGVLYDREVVPAGTRWPLVMRLDWLYAGAEAVEAEGILGYVLAEHWMRERCWIGGDISRGLGWCHVEKLQAWRLDTTAYDRWLRSNQDPKELPGPLKAIPTVGPTRSWCFRILDSEVDFGEYRPDAKGPAWGLDMLSVGCHAADQSVQPTGAGHWPRPSWTRPGDRGPVRLDTDRTLLMDEGRPVLPGSSVRGPMRHTLSRGARASGRHVKDPHLEAGTVGENDPAGAIFGTVERSSRVLIRDAYATQGWAAARLHMHAEDEFSAGSYGSAKRNAIRLLRGKFPVRIVVEGPDEATVSPLTTEIDRIVALGALSHLPVGGHKTRGAGWGRWTSTGWQNHDVVKARSWAPSPERQAASPPAGRRHESPSVGPDYGDRDVQETWVSVNSGNLDGARLTLGRAVDAARAALGDQLIAWWCEPSIDLSLTVAPATFGRLWPSGSALRVDEVVFFAAEGSWRAAHTVSGVRWVLIKEVPPDTPGALQAAAVRTRARLHGDSTRFAFASPLHPDKVSVREWHDGHEPIGFTLQEWEIR